ncbi:MAG: hypothetical protein EZS28_031985 [Streblomastix strix]|uniref:Uncharacterized protein n=1 Tax=Streblomastix strix TaxID=222440 RepID=A0A5J4UQ04_9EUKA|nr:MAG: hypothetical protein EZS28_031985 [Streblomastix strix]
MQQFQYLKLPYKLNYSIGTVSYNVFVQSGTHNPTHIHNRIDSHLEDLIMNELPKMPDDQFRVLKEGIIHQLREVQIDLQYDYDLLIRGFLNRTFTFIADEALGCAIETMNFSEFLMRIQSYWKGQKYLNEVIIPQYQRNNTLNDIQYSSNQEERQKQKIIENDSIKNINSNPIIEQQQFNVDDPRIFPFGSRAYFRVFAPRFAHLKDKPPEEMNIAENQQENINSNQNSLKENNQEKKKDSDENKEKININDTKVDDTKSKRHSCPPSPLPYFFVKDVKQFKRTCSKWGLVSFW